MNIKQNITYAEKGEILAKYNLLVYGCQMNEHDGEKIAGILEKCGYQPTSHLEEADLVAILTCSVRASAENKIYGLLGRLQKLKEQKRSLQIIIGGCMTQQKDLALKMRQRFPGVDLFFGTHNLAELEDLIRRLQARQIRRYLIHHPEHQGIAEGLPLKRKHPFKAWVDISYGCNNFCTYCIVPYVRGRERSRRPEEIIREIEALVQQGYREVTLLGQNVDSYGQPEGEISFARLLEKINAIQGLQRIRFMTSHPKDISEDLLKIMVQADKVCEHIHLPVQSGSSRILKKMNRGYSRENYLELIQMIRSYLPQIVLTSDVMVGFPGETEEDYQQTMELLRQVQFDSAYTFIYNVRPGTPAAKMPDQIPQAIKSQRIQAMVDLQNSLTLAKNQQEVGQVQEILVEGASKLNPLWYCGRNRGNKLVIFPQENYQPGQLISLKITEGTLSHLKGIPLS